MKLCQIFDTNVVYLMEIELRDYKLRLVAFRIKLIKMYANTYTLDIIPMLVYVNLVIEQMNLYERLYLLKKQSYL